MDGIYAPGIRRLGPDNATLSVHTRRGGAAAKAGHDLELHVTRWEATLDLEAGTAGLTADGSSLRVEKGTGGMMELGDEDKDNIHRTIDDEILEKRNITFRATKIAAVEGTLPGEEGSGAGPSETYRIEGELSLAGTTQPIAFDVILADGSVSGSVTVAQTRWGMKPFSALFGTLKVLDEVEVRLQSR